MLDDLELVLCCDDLLLHVMLLDHLLQNQVRNQFSQFFLASATNLADQLLLKKKVCCLLHTVLVTIVDLLDQNLVHILVN